MIDLLILILQIFGFSLFLLLLLDTLIWFLNGFNLFFLTLRLIWKWFLFLIITKIFFRIVFGFIILVHPCYVQSNLLKLFIDRVILILILSSHIKRFHLINLVWVLVLVAIVNNVIFLVVIGWAKSVLISALSQSGIETQILFQIVDLVGFLYLLEVHHKILELQSVIFQPSVSQLEEAHIWVFVKFVFAVNIFIYVFQSIRWLFEINLIVVVYYWVSFEIDADIRQVFIYLFCYVFFAAEI